MHLNLQLMHVLLTEASLSCQKAIIRKGNGEKAELFQITPELNLNSVTTGFME